jgi:hypothetical protein
MRNGRNTGLATLLVGVAASGAPIERLLAHHSFAMYDRSTQYVFTGVVDNINPDPAHLQIVFVPLNEARDALVRNAAGERVAWSVEMEGAAASAREGISSTNFPRGTVFSVGLTPLRNGNPGGVRVEAIFKCPQGKAPAAGKHCDSVEGATHHGEGALAAPNKAWMP